MTDINNVVVIGSGTMGSQIGMVAALSGYNTTIVDISQEALDRAEDMLRSRMARDVEKQRRTQEDVDAAFARLRLLTDQAEAVKDADIVIEAAIEDLEIKRKIFTQLDEQTPRTHYFGHQLLQHCVFTARGSHQTAGQGVQHALFQPRARSQGLRDRVQRAHLRRDHGRSGNACAQDES